MVILDLFLRFLESRLRKRGGPFKVNFICFRDVVPIFWRVMSVRGGNRLANADRTIDCVCNLLSSCGAESRSFCDLYFCIFGNAAIIRRKSFWVNLLRRLEVTQCLQIWYSVSSLNTVKPKSWNTILWIVATRSTKSALVLKDLPRRNWHTIFFKTDAEINIGSSAGIILSSSAYRLISSCLSSIEI